MNARRRKKAKGKRQKSKIKDSQQKLKEFYAEVQEQTARLENINAECLNCKKGCSACCVDEIAVFEIEAENIKQHHAEIIKNTKPHAKGACAFLDETGACRIYKNRPYVCRTQGLPLRWFDVFENELVDYAIFVHLMKKVFPLKL